ncbi:hypothetical protein AVEN_43957-1 [Araneus ventricosus]|uniref:Uncharacterized protein n=1 Tax=Araneus ventricosus TaxID=182803 RepID=A0A4Y2C201_ARAVE|nr:hypothetical protein AVEN_9050-1 [Araneus ventricosus]GBL98157.1 hypothetical protein AVEN_43957-1 [Araneus ventricosus]
MFYTIQTGNGSSLHLFFNLNSCELMPHRQPLFLFILQRSYEIQLQKKNTTAERKLCILSAVGFFHSNGSLLRNHFPPLFLPLVTLMFIGAALSCAEGTGDINESISRDTLVRRIQLCSVLTREEMFSVYGGEFSITDEWFRSEKTEVIGMLTRQIINEKICNDIFQNF